MLFLADLPLPIQERVTCSVIASVKYHVPTNIMLAVAEKEAGKPGLWSRNANGSYDVGSMQFNTAYLNDLARYRITAADVAAPGCYSYELAAWRLRQHISKDSGDIWTRAANYHSRTARHNAAYRVDLMRKASKWADWLESRFPMSDIKRSESVAAMPAASGGATLFPKGYSARVGGTIPAPAYVPRMLLTSRGAKEK